MLAPSSSTLRSLPSFSLGGRLQLLDCDSSLEELKSWDNQALLSAQEALLSQHNEHRDREQQKVNLQMDDVLANISWAENMKSYINETASSLHEIESAYSEHVKQDAVIKQLVKEIHSGGKPEFFAEQLDLLYQSMCELKDQLYLRKRNFRYSLVKGSSRGRYSIIFYLILILIL